MQLLRATMPFTAEAFAAILADNNAFGVSNTQFFAFVYAPKDQIINAFPPVGGFASTTRFWPQDVGSVYYIQYDSELSGKLQCESVEGFAPAPDNFFTTHEAL